MLNPLPDWPDLLKLSKHLNFFHFPWVANYGIYFHWIFCVWPFHLLLTFPLFVCATIALRDSLLLLLCLGNCSHFILFLPTVLHLLCLWSQMRTRASLARKLNCALWITSPALQHPPPAPEQQPMGHIVCRVLSPRLSSILLLPRVPVWDTFLFKLSIGILLCQTKLLLHRDAHAQDHSICVCWTQRWLWVTFLSHQCCSGFCPIYFQPGSGFCISIPNPVIMLVVQQSLVTWNVS